VNTFDEIIGNESVKLHLKNSIKMQKTSHAYIFEGEKGMGKRFMADSFAKALQCEAGEENPCNKCSSCIAADSQNHPDIIYVKPTNKTGFGVDDIREQINTDIFTKPYKYRYKIYIVEEGDKMTEQAQNALLKTLEEPPQYGIIMILTENLDKLLSTIISRCVHIALKPLKQSEVKEYLEKNLEMNSSSAHIYAALSRGNIGKARMYIEEQEFEEIRLMAINAIEAVINKDDLAILELANTISLNKEKSDMMIEILLTWLRDLLIVKELKEENNIIHKDKLKTLLKQGEGIAYNRICALISRLIEIQEIMKVHVNYQLAIETLLFEC